jgi:hypothetical protein
MQRSLQVSWLGWFLVVAGCSDGGAPDPAAGASGSAGAVTSAGQSAGGGSSAGAGPSGVAGSGGASAGSGAVTTAGSGNAAMGGSGSASGGMAGGGTASGGRGGSGPTSKVFSQCRLHFGTIDTKAKENPALIPQLDFFTPGWMGVSDTFDQSYVCEEGKSGAVLGNLVPVIVAYVSAFYVKRHHGKLCDCNVNECGETNGRPNDLCNFGAQYIKQDLAAIVGVYENYAKGYANCYGTTRPIVFEMEPDWYQYVGSSQTSPLSKQQAGDILEQYVAAIRKHLPNAHFSIDISPWVDDNGASNGQDWYSNFDLSLFTFANTSGGSTLAANSKIRSDNNMTWRGVSQVTGKTVLADTGYGANGVSAGHDANWDMVSNLNARIDDGVISISQYNPRADWGTTIAAIRSQLKTPKVCP